ncbi:DNA mismatch repair protein Msh2 [Parasteatoda tepidariorum]|uniref:DNA mismatch repair protein Msh2 n=1 Tax=Parasteatoda tepidariorum TaxID=114398 RepID=UPI001C71BD43|nr:DNA mismatch repair protein Msh2 [Parasteatoda tepidariorum]XP_042897664.1 DNA mismatch repair protein Msh2 [Parasteatoda tepidariorum]
MSDASEFIKYFEELPKVGSLCRIFERSEDFFVYGDNATLTCKGLKVGVTRTLESDAGSLSYVKIPKNSLVETVRFLLFYRHCCVEMLKNTGTARSQEWTVTAKASPGNTIAFEDILFAKDNSYCMQQKGIIAVKMTTSSINLLVGIAYCDPVLREFHVCEFQDTPDFSILQSVLVQLSPQECVLPLSAKQSETAPGTLKSIIETHKIAVTQKKSDVFEPLNTADVLRLFISSSDLEYNFEEWQSSNKGCSLAAAIRYLELLSDENNFEQFQLIEFNTQLYARIDKACSVGLGLFAEKDSDVDEKDYLYGFLNSCRTSAGERLLMQWIKQPLVDKIKIEERLDLVDIFVQDRTFMIEVQHFLEKFVDIELLARKIHRRVINLQDFYKIHTVLTKIPNLSKYLSQYDGDKKAVLEHLINVPLKEKIEELDKLREMIDDMIDFDAVENREYVIKPDFDENLKEMREEMENLQKSMKADLEKTKTDLGLSTVKLELYERNGYAYRITLKEESNLRNKKQYTILTTGNSGVKFQSPALLRMSDNYATLKRDYEEIQKKIVIEMIAIAVPYTPHLKELSGTLSWLDVTVALAHKAANACNTYVRPIITEKDYFYLCLKDMRHPVLEEKLQNFIPNSVELSAQGKNFYFVSGPNMGGKSTYIRSVAINVLLAQIGSFVPCSSAEVSLTDAIYTRIGASDNPTSGISTFMHEMLEMQRMLKNGTSRSLLIIDELGRGTSTADGYGLSHSISCEIAFRLKAPCLFATHFHELTSLSDTVPVIGNLHVEAIQSEKEITFLYQVKEGVCTKSFGVHVAELTGFPPKVIEDANAKLIELENSIMTYEEVSNIFGHLPNAEKLLTPLKGILPSKGEFLSSKDEAMEVDENTSTNGTAENNSSCFTETIELEKAKELLRKLEEMEKAVFS